MQIDDDVYFAPCSADEVEDMSVFINHSCVRMWVFVARWFSWRCVIFKAARSCAAAMRWSLAMIMRWIAIAATRAVAVRLAAKAANYSNFSRATGIIFRFLSAISFNGRIA